MTPFKLEKNQRASEQNREPAVGTADWTHSWPNPVRHSGPPRGSLGMRRDGR